jgi:hypothetical protein
MDATLDAIVAVLKVVLSIVVIGAVAHLALTCLLDRAGWRRR